MPHTPHILRPTRLAFTLIELLVVIAIIAILATIAVPAIRTISKGNDQAQSVNLIRSMISTARSIAISQHRQAGVVFFEETSTFSQPYNTAQTAMQIFVEAYSQPSGLPSQATGFVYYSTARQYLPTGVKLAALGDSGIIFEENSPGTSRTRAVLFDATGQLIMRTGLVAPTPVASGTSDPYPLAYGDWHFAPVENSLTTVSSPGFFLYNKNEFDTLSQASTFDDTQRRLWLLKNADVVVINPNTGTVIK